MPRYHQQISEWTARIKKITNCILLSDGREHLYPLSQHQPSGYLPFSAFMNVVCLEIASASSDLIKFRRGGKKWNFEFFTSTEWALAPYFSSKDVRLFLQQPLLLTDGCQKTQWYIQHCSKKTQSLKWSQIHQNCLKHHNSVLGDTHRKQKAPLESSLFILTYKEEQVFTK